MNGVPYKRTFAAKGSALYAAIMEGDDAKAKAIYDATTARAESLLNVNTTRPAMVYPVDSPHSVKDAHEQAVPGRRQRECQG